MRRADVVLKLEEKMDEEGWSQAETSRRLGVTEGTVSRMLSGKREAGGKVLLAMVSLWPGIFSDDGERDRKGRGMESAAAPASPFEPDEGGDDGDRKGDEHPGSGGDRVPAAVDDLRLPGFGVPGELDE